MFGGNITELIASLGFPILACCAMGWYVKYTTDKYQNDLSEERGLHRKEIKVLEEAIVNNTVAISKLCEKLN